MKSAIVHDYITQRGGAERVVLSLCRALPEAPIHTSLYDPQATFPEFAAQTIIPMGLNRIRPLRRHHRLGLPIYAAAFSRLVVNADLVVCTSSGWAHGAHVTGLKIVYCFTPARWLYQSRRYLGSTAQARAFGLLRPALASWDRRSAATADRYVTSSRVVRERIHVLYGIDAEIIPPPHTIDPQGAKEPVRGLDPGFVLCVSRLLAYKKVDAVVAAFESLPDLRLVVVGVGPETRVLKAAAPPNVTFLATVTDEELRWLYTGAAGLVAASYEDYGLTPLEAAACGTPSAVLRWGGFLDTVVDGETGVFFERPEPSLIAAAVRRLVTEPPGPEILLHHADQFSEAVFVERVRSLVGAMAPGA